MIEKALILSSAMFPMRLIFILLIFSVVFACAQQTPVIVPEFHPTAIGMGVSDFKNTPPDLKLVPKQPGGRKGQIWIRNIGNALVIVGQVDGKAPNFPHNNLQMLFKDHVEVWLAAAPDVPMPPIGWGNQFGEELLPRGPDSCSTWASKHSPDSQDKVENEKACREWALQQQQYREAFKKLFVRQWLLSPNYAVESYATPAYELIAAKFATGPEVHTEGVSAVLKPKGNVRMLVSPAGGRGYIFQITISYTAFPPMNPLNLQNLWLMVDVFNAAPEGKKMGPFSSSSPLRAFGKPETFNLLHLEPQRSFRLGPCDVALEGTDKYGNKHAAWFIPQHDQVVPGSEFESESFIVVNEAQGYAYEPMGLSPIVRVAHHFWRSVGANEWVCGPELTYQKGERSVRYDRIVAEDAFDARRLQDGTLLIKSGPEVYYSEFGSGQCGACPRYALSMYSLDRNLNLGEALALGGVVQGDDDAVDFTINADWSQVVQYKEKPSEDNNPQAKPTWSATTYCLKNAKYEECGERQNVQPPNPPTLRFGDDSN